MGLSLARQYHPSAITLDVFLPDMLGWTVLNNLKLDPGTRHIPVQMVSLEEERQHGLSHGAFSYLVKPATTGELETALDRLRIYSALTPSASSSSRTTIASDRAWLSYWAYHDIEIDTAASGAEALSSSGKSPSIAACWTSACPT